MSFTSQNLLGFRSAASPEEDLLVVRAEGVEAISRPYRYVIDLVSTQRSVDTSALLAHAASFGIKQEIELAGGGSGRRTVLTHGVLESFEEGEQRQDWFRYRAVLVARMAKLAENFVSQVYLDMDVAGFVTANLQGIGLVEGTDFEFRLSRDYRRRDYVVQYEETDLDFVHRWLEHEGIYYFFLQEEGGEKVVFADSATAHPPIYGGDGSIAFRAGSEPADGGIALSDVSGDEVVHAIAATRKRVAREVQLKDYNWRNPSDPLRVTREVPDVVGDGLHWETWGNFRDDTEGGDLATVRADEIRAGERVLRGAGSSKSFRAGSQFHLGGHFRDSFNSSFVITSVHVVAEQTPGSEGGGAAIASYGNRFEAIPADREFRPARVTRWPKVEGVVHAVIDSTVSGRADINEDGAYRVRLPWDVAGSTHEAGRASTFIRMAQPYAGAGYGQHFPLHGNTEVILTHIDGDPDRPIIAGAVPNRTMRSPVTAANAQKNTIRTASGNVFEMDDTPGLEGLTMYNATVSAITSFRNVDAGGGGGAGGLTPPVRQPRDPGNGADAGADLERPAGAPSSSAVASGFSSRVGLFSGPLSQLSPDGDALLPGSPSAASGVGIALSPDSNGGDPPPPPPPVGVDAERMFLDANSVGTVPNPDNAGETQDRYAYYLDHVVNSTSGIGGRFTGDGPGLFNNASDSDALGRPDPEAMRALDTAVDENLDEPELRRRARAELRAAVAATVIITRYLPQVDGHVGLGEGANFDPGSLVGRLVTNAVSSIDGQQVAADIPDALIDGELAHLDDNVDVSLAPYGFGTDDRANIVGQSRDQTRETLGLTGGSTRTRINGIRLLARKQNLDAQASWGGDISENLDPGQRSQTTARHGSESDEGNENRKAQDALRHIEAAYALWRLADNLAAGGSLTDAWLRPSGALAFGTDWMASAAPRQSSSSFTGTTTQFDYIQGQDLAVVDGHVGNFLNGSRTSYAYGPGDAASFSYANFARSTSQSITRGNVVEETIIGGALTSHTTILGGIRGGTSFTYAPAYGRADYLQASAEDRAAVASAGPRTIFGNVDSENQLIHGTINGRNLTIYSPVEATPGNQDDPDAIAINGANQHIYGNIEGQNKYVYGYSNGETFIRDENRSKTVVGSSHSESLCQGDSFSQSETKGKATSISFVNQVETSSHVGTSHSQSLGGIHNSLGLQGYANSYSGSLSTSISAGASASIKLAASAEINASASASLSFGHALKLNAAGETKIDLGTSSDIDVVRNGVTMGSKTEAAGTLTALATVIQFFSSRRWKQNIATLDDALGLVQSLRGVRYEWKDNGTPDVGFIAEEVGEVLPELVEFEDNGVDAKSVCYAKVTAVLVEAVKQQQAQIEALREMVAEPGNANVTV